MSSLCSSWPSAVSTSGSVGRRSSQTWTKLLSRAWLETTRIFLREGQLEVEGRLSLSDNDTSKANVWFRATMQRKLLAIVARRSELFSSTREVDDTPKEMLIPCWVTEKSRATSFLKITTQLSFLPVKSTAESQHARTSIEKTRKRCK